MSSSHPTTSRRCSRRLFATDSSFARRRRWPARRRTACSTPWRAESFRRADSGLSVIRFFDFLRGLAPQPRLIWAVAIGAGLIALAVASPVVGFVAVIYHIGLVTIATRDLALLPGRSGYSVRRSLPDPFSLGEPEEVTVVIQNHSAAGLMAKVSDHAPADLRPEPREVSGRFDPGGVLKVTYRTYSPRRGAQVIIAIDCGRLMTAPAGDLDKLDHAVNAALMLAWVAQAYGDRVGLLTFDDRVTSFIKPERGTTQLRRITEALYAVQPEYVEPDFGHAMTHLGLRVGRRSMVVLLTDVQDPEASRELVAHALRLAARHLVLVVAMSDPAALSARDDPIDTTDRAYEWAAAEEFVASRRESFELLRRGGVLGLDVVAGRLSPSLVERYLELKERALL